MVRKMTCMFLVTNIKGMRRATRLRNDRFMALTRAGVGPGVNIESHRDIAIEGIVVSQFSVDRRKLLGIPTVKPDFQIKYLSM